jgi:hypothetical protein
MSDLSDLRRILALYAQRLDDRNIDGLVAMFTPDARVEDPTGVYKGRAKIREWLDDSFAKQPAGRMEQHQAANAVLTVNDDRETAVGRTDLFCFRSLETTPWELEVVFRHHDRFVKVKGEWHFSHKAIEIRGGFQRNAASVSNTVSID